MYHIFMIRHGWMDGWICSITIISPIYFFPPCPLWASYRIYIIPLLALSRQPDPLYRPTDTTLTSRTDEMSD